MKGYVRWLLINLLLPFTPFVLRIFVSIIGNRNLTGGHGGFEIPEILFFSVYVCIVNLNINLYHNKGFFEFFLRLFLIVVLIMDFIVLAMYYSDNVGRAGYFFSAGAAAVPAIIAPIYKFKYSRSRA